MSGRRVTHPRVSGHGSEFKDWGSNLGERRVFPTVDGRVWGVASEACMYSTAARMHAPQAFAHLYHGPGLRRNSQLRSVKDTGNPTVQSKHSIVMALAGVDTM